MSREQQGSREKPSSDTPLQTAEFWLALRNPSKQPERNAPAARYSVGATAAVLGPPAKLSGRSDRPEPHHQPQPTLTPNPSR